MQLLKKILNFYIFSNIHVAVSAFCLTKITLLKFGFESNITPFFVASSVIVSYNFIRFYEVKTNKLSWLKKWFVGHQKAILLLSLVSIVFLLCFLFIGNINLKSLVILFPFAFMTLFYVVPILKVGNYEISFRNFPGVKIFSIAIAWAGVTVLFPLYEQGVRFDNTIYIEFFQRILILIVIIIPFDIRDVDSDSINLKTLPIVFGVEKSKWLGTGLLVLFVILSFFKNDIKIVTFSIAIIAGLYLWFSSSKKSRFYTSFWVEAIPIAWLLLMIFFLKN